MTRDELIQLVKDILTSPGNEEEVEALVDMLEKNVPDPSVTDYIFYKGLTPEQVIDKALAYTPIILPSSRQDNETTQASPYVG